MRYLLVLCLLGILACGTETKPVEEETTSNAMEQKTETVDKKNIVFFGNSLTAAYGLSPEQGFAGLIAHKLDSLDMPFEVVNAGISGETTAGGLARIDWILKQPVHVFILELGGNDGLRGIDPKSTYDNLSSIVEKVKEAYPEAEVLITGMEAPPNMGDDYTQAFRAVFPRISEEKNIALMPFLLDGVAGDPDLNLPDGLHPNPSGHRIVANNLFTYLEPLLK